MKTTTLMASCAALAVAAFGFGRTEHRTTAVQADAFVHKAMQGDSAEIALGKLASTRASDKKVKDFAEDMVKDHSKSAKELKSALGGQTIPTEMNKEHLQTIKKLGDLNGPEFDHAYMQTMVKEHKKMEQLLSSRTGGKMKGDSGSKHMNTDTGNGRAGGPSSDNDAAVTEWASRTLPVVQEHLTKAQEILQTLPSAPNAERHEYPGAKGGRTDTTHVPGSSASPSSAQPTPR